MNERTCPTWCQLAGPHPIHCADLGELETPPGVIIDVSVQRDTSATQPEMVIELEAFDETGATAARAALAVPISRPDVDVLLERGTGARFIGPADDEQPRIEPRPVPHLDVEFARAVLRESEADTSATNPRYDAPQWHGRLEAILRTLLQAIDEQEGTRP